MKDKITGKTRRKLEKDPKLYNYSRIIPLRIVEFRLRDWYDLDGDAYGD